MEEIENEEWDDDKNEEGYIDDNFVQLAIEDKSDDGFDFDEHIRNLLKAREEKEKSRVELTEDRYAEEIRIDPEKEDRKAAASGENAVTIYRRRTEQRCKR